MTSPQELCDRYASNEVAADQWIAGRPITITEPVLEINKDFMNEAVLEFYTSSCGHMSAAMANESKAATAALTKGQTVTITCPKVIRILGNPTASECVLQPAQAPTESQAHAAVLANNSADDAAAPIQASTRAPPSSASDQKGAAAIKEPFHGGTGTQLPPTPPMDSLSPEELRAALGPASIPRIDVASNCRKGVLDADAQDGVSRTKDKVDADVIDCEELELGALNWLRKTQIPPLDLAYCQGPLAHYNSYGAAYVSIMMCLELQGVGTIGPPPRIVIPSPGAASEAAEAAPTVAHADATPPASPVTSTAPAPAAPAPQAVPMKDEGPSFDCSKVIVPTAITICSNPELSALDRQMATLYYATDYAINPNTRAQQRQWIKQRNDTCGVSVDCLRTQFNDRIRQLQEAVPAPASGPLAAAISQDRIASIRAMSEAQFEEQFRCPESYATDAELGPWLADLRAWLQTHDAQSTQASREAFLRKLLTMHNCHPRTSQHR